jgi:hypothetical protein
MAEIAGVALGVAGLAGLYGVAIEAFGHISAAHSFSRDFEVLSTRYDIRRTRMLQWGDGVALLSENPQEQDPRLHDVELQPLINRALDCIGSLLTDADKLNEKYGLRPFVSEHELELAAVGEGAALLSRNRLKRFARAYERLRCLYGGGSRRPSVVVKAKWAVQGADRFRLLLSDLDRLIEDLYTLVPITPTFHRLMVKEDIDSLPEDMQALRLVEEACAGDGEAQSIQSPSWLEAVSLRIEASERASLCQQHVTAWLKGVPISYSREAESMGQSVLTPMSETDWRVLMNLHQTQKSAPGQPAPGQPAPKQPGLDEEAQKRKRRRELHNIVERRRRDDINERIQDLWRLTPKERIDEVILQEKFSRYFKLPGQPSDDTNRIPLRSESAEEAIAALAPFLDVDWSKSPNKGQILTSTVRWVAELMQILERKFKEEDELRSFIDELGGIGPFERHPEDKMIREHIAKCMSFLEPSNDPMTSDFGIHDMSGVEMTGVEETRAGGEVQR